MIVETLFGTLSAEKSDDPNMPGIIIGIAKVDKDDGQLYKTPILVVDQVSEDNDSREYTLRVGIWGDYENEDFTSIHKIETLRP